MDCYEKLTITDVFALEIIKALRDDFVDHAIPPKDYAATVYVYADSLTKARASMQEKNFKKASRKITKDRKRMEEGKGLFCGRCFNYDNKINGCFMRDGIEPETHACSEYKEKKNVN